MMIYYDTGSRLSFKIKILVYKLVILLDPVTLTLSIDEKSN